MYLQSTCNITSVDFKNLWLNVADRRIAPLITPENGPFFSEVVIISLFSSPTATIAFPSWEVVPLEPCLAPFLCETLGHIRHLSFAKRV